jgi:hypothetical protein
MHVSLASSGRLWSNLNFRDACENTATGPLLLGLPPTASRPRRWVGLRPSADLSSWLPAESLVPATDWMLFPLENHRSDQVLGVLHDGPPTGVSVMSRDSCPGCPGAGHSLTRPTSYSPLITDRLLRPSDTGSHLGNGCGELPGDTALASRDADLRTG